MSPKTKTRPKNAPRQAVFTVRRIANRNPRASLPAVRRARNYHTFRRKLARTTAGFLLFLLLLIGASLSGDLRSNVILSDAENFICSATEIGQAIDKATRDIISLNQNFPTILEELFLCADAECAAEERIYETENQITALETQIFDLEKRYDEDRENLGETLSKLEDRVLFCEDASRCSKAKMALRAARDCEQEFARTEMIFSTKTDVADTYPLPDTKGSPVTGVSYIYKLSTDLLEQRIRTDNFKATYERCLLANPESLCRKYTSNAADSVKLENQIASELRTAKSNLMHAIGQLDTDIVAFEISRKDKTDLTADQGLGWCETELSNAKQALGAQAEEAADLKLIYDNAYDNLQQKKSELSQQLEAEAKAADAETVARIQAEELHAAAEAEKSTQKQQVGTLLNFWGFIRNLL
ncbi:MAG: hypothetical protein ABIH35_02395 [Patescibacteria group bacterium]